MTELKLKTLKDLNSFGQADNGYLISTGDIKKEAIKWVKVNPNYITIEEWLDFFNITEDDLK